MRGVLIAALSAIAACSDPYAGIEDDPCVPGHVRAEGGACAVPRDDALSIDGMDADWVSVPELSTGVQVGRNGAFLHVRARFAAAAGRARHVIELAAQSIEPVSTIDRVVIDGDAVSYERAGAALSPDKDVAPAAARLPTGFEVKIPLAVIPFRHGAQITIVTELSDDGATWRRTEASGPMRVCWNGADKEVDPCRG